MEILHFQAKNGENLHFQAKSGENLHFQAENGENEKATNQNPFISKNLGNRIFGAIFCLSRPAE